MLRRPRRRATERRQCRRAGWTCLLDCIAVDCSSDPRKRNEIEISVSSLKKSRSSSHFLPVWQQQLNFRFSAEVGGATLKCLLYYWYLMDGCWMETTFCTLSLWNNRPDSFSRRMYIFLHYVQLIFCHNFSATVWNCFWTEAIRPNKSIYFTVSVNYDSSWW